MKITAYFSHDSNSRNDEKIIALRIKLGWEGYGLYWAIIEKLRESTNYRLSLNFNLLAFDLRTDNEKIKSIVTGFGLFTIDGDVFYSKSLCDRMLIKDEASDRARQKALKRWGNSDPIDAEIVKSDATALLQHPKKDAKKVKESKVNDYVGERPVAPPVRPKPPGPKSEVPDDARPRTMDQLAEVAKADNEIQSWAYRQGILPADVPALIDDFALHCKNRRKTHINLILYQQHLVSWYPKRPMNNAHAKTKTTSTEQDEYAARRRRAEERDRSR